MKGYQKLLCCLLGVLPWGSEAATSTLTVKVTVTSPPPCVINNDQPIVVQFDEVMTTQVDGTHYRRPVNFTLSCTGGVSNALKLQVYQSNVGFDGQVLRTDKAGLGIALLLRGERLAVNSWLNFTYPTKPVLEVVPVRQAGVTLTGGKFSASAILKVAYQ